MSIARDVLFSRIGTQYIPSFFWVRRLFVILRNVYVWCRHLKSNLLSLLRRAACIKEFSGIFYIAFCPYFLSNFLQKYFLLYHIVCQRVCIIVVIFPWKKSYKSFVCIVKSSYFCTRKRGKAPGSDLGCGALWTRISINFICKRSTRDRACLPLFRGSCSGYSTVTLLDR